MSASIALKAQIEKPYCSYIYPLLSTINVKNRVIKGVVIKGQGLVLILAFLFLNIDSLMFIQFLVALCQAEAFKIE